MKQGSGHSVQNNNLLLSNKGDSSSPGANTTMPAASEMALPSSRSGHRQPEKSSTSSSIRLQQSWLLASLALALLLVATTPTASHAAYLFAAPPQSSSSSSSSATGGNGNGNGNGIPMVEGYSRTAGQLVFVEQQPSKPVVLVAGQKGQKEAEQAMNPNEVGGSASGSSEGGPRFLDPLASEVAELEDLEAAAAGYEDLEKRAKWNSLQGGWGKRAPNNWNKLSAAWGKRRLPGAGGSGSNSWNNLSGMWGKKRAKWNELSGMWGKRAWKDMQAGWGKKKRSGSSPHWNKLRGMWGKRSAV